MSETTEKPVSDIKPKKKKKQRPHSSPKGDVALRIIKEKLLKKEPIVMSEVLRQAGFAPSSIAQYSLTVDRLRPKLEVMIEKIENHRNDIIEKLPTKIKDASYGDLMRGLEVTTKNLQLLGGKPTDIVGLPKEDQERLDSLIHR